MTPDAVLTEITELYRNATLARLDGADRLADALISDAEELISHLGDTP